MMNIAGTAQAFPMPRTAAAARGKGLSVVDRWGFLFVACVLACTGVAFAAGFTTGLSLLTAIGFLAAAFGLYRPAVGLTGISILATLDTIDRALLFTRGPLPWNTFNYWLLVVMFLSIIFLFRLNDPQSRLLELLIVVFLFGLLFTPVMEDGMETVLNVVTFFGLLVYFSRNSREESAWFWQAVVAGVVGVAFGLAYYLQKDLLPEVNANAWAYFPATAIFAICLGFRFAPRKGGGQLILGLLALVNLAWIFLSGSRGTMIVGSIAMIYMIFSMRSKVLQVSYIVVGALVATFVVLSFTQLEGEALHRINKLLDPEQSMVGRTSGRSDLAYGGLLIFLDHPFGVGTGGFTVAWARMGFRQSLSGYGYGAVREAHAGWIKVLAENGFIGFLVLVAFTLSFAEVGWRKRKTRGLLSLGIFVTCLLSLAWISTEFAAKGIWFLSAGATALLNMKGAAGLPSLPRRRALPAQKGRL